MTIDEQLVRAVVAGVIYAKRYDDSNPDVGMGPSLETLLDRYLKLASLNLTPTEEREALRRLNLVHW